MDDLKTYNMRVKIYPNGETRVTLFNQAVFNPDKIPTVQSEMMSLRLKQYWESRKYLDYEDVTDIRKDNAKVTKEKVFDIAILNSDIWSHMFTLTVNPDKIDRYDYLTCGKKVCTFWHHMKQRYGTEYLLIPELHKDGAIHFHGLISAGSLPLENSGKKDKSGREIFNIKTYHYGYTTAVPIDKGTSDYVCKYITKYITKDLVRITPRSFYYSQGLKTEVETQYFNVDFLNTFNFVPPRDICGEWLRVKYF